MTAIKFSEPPLFTTLRTSPQFSAKHLKEFKDMIKQDFIQKKHFGEIEIFHHSVMPDLLIIKNYLSDIQPTNEEGCVIVDSICGSAVLRGAHIFARGVLCLPPCAVRGDEYDVFADLEGRCLRGSKYYAGNKLFLGRGRIQLDRHDLFSKSAQALSGIGVTMIEPVCVAPSLTSGSLQEFGLFAQNLPSVVCGHVLEAKSNEVVLDMCCAPGGKLSHIAHLMQDKGVLIGLEKSSPRAEQTKTLIDSMKLQSVRVYRFDSTKAFDRDSKNNPMCDPPPYNFNSFKRILLDAPCSGLGKRPSLMIPRSDKELASYPSLQMSLFKTAVNLLRVGGTLVYSTCTTSKEENENIVLWALNHFSDSIVLSHQSPNIRPSPLVFSQPNVQRFDPTYFCKETELVDQDTIGFFIAKFVKIA